MPHVLNVQAGANKWDPVNNAVYEVYFTLPDGIKAEFAADEAILTEQVISVSGLNGLDKTTGQGKQTFLGASVSFQEPVINDTFIEFTIEFNLNLRNKTDNFVHKLFRAWEQLNYNLADGTRTLKSQYCSDSFRVSEANLWVNRMIGDQRGDAGKFTHTVMTFRSAAEPLRPSGLLGPVRIETRK